MAHNLAEAATRALEPHLHTTELSNIIAARQTAVKAPCFLCRNLSYVESDNRALQHRADAVLNLQLHAAHVGARAGSNGAAVGQALGGSQAAVASNGGSGSSNHSTQDVVIVAVCIAYGSQAFVPISVRGLPVPAHANDATVAVELPLFGRTQPAGLAVVVIHQRSSWLANLVSLACHRRASSMASSSSSSKKSKISCAPAGSHKVLSPSVTASAALHLVPSGAEVAYAVLPLDGLLQGAAVGCERQGRLIRLDGILTTHVPPPGTNGGSGFSAPAAAQFPWFELQQRCPGTASQGSHGHAKNGSSNSGSQMQFWYSMSLSSAGSGGDGSKAQQQRLTAGLGSVLSGSKRKAAALNGKRGPAKEDAADQQRSEHASQPAASQQQQGAAAALPSQQDQQQEPLITYCFCSYDGSRLARAQLRGFTCPLSCCRRLRCRGWAALQQHLQASHSYHSYYFCEAVQPGELEVYLRCKPAWCDAQGGFLPRQLALASLEGHPLSALLSRTHIHHLFYYWCPKAQRRLRFEPWGLYPRDEVEEQLEKEAEDAAAAHMAAAGEAAPSEEAAAEAARGGVLPSSSEETSDSDEGSEDEPPAAVTLRRAGRVKAPAAAAAGAAVAARRNGRGGRKAVPVRQPSRSLQLLNNEGRPKFYHSRTCVAMSRQEVFGQAEEEPESPGELAEWKRDCKERLEDLPGLCAEERQFMFDWNLFLHRNPIHGDSDLPTAVERFVTQHAQQLQQDGPFRRCLVAHMLNLWRFRLLSPQQLHELTRALPPLRLA